MNPSSAVSALSGVWRYRKAVYPVTSSVMFWKKYFKACAEETFATYGAYGGGIPCAICMPTTYPCTSKTSFGPLDASIPNASYMGAKTAGGNGKVVIGTPSPKETLKEKSCPNARSSAVTTPDVTAADKSANDDDKTGSYAHALIKPTIASCKPFNVCGNAESAKLNSLPADLMISTYAGLIEMICFHGKEHNTHVSLE